MRQAKKASVRKKHKKYWIIAAACAVVLILLVIFSVLAMRSIRPPSIGENEHTIFDESGNPITISSADRKEDFFTFLVIGTDNGVATDTILVASLDAVNKTIDVMSIPRDTMSNVNRPAVSKKINAAYAVGKIPQVKKELKDLIGFEVDRYVLVDLEGFVKLIDTIGGVEVNVPDTLDQKYGKYYTGGMHYDDPTQNLHIHLDKGLQTLNGEDALGFVRFRSGYPEADLARIRAQQEFLQATAKKLANPANLAKIDEFVEIFKDNVKTDLTLGELVWLGQIGLSMDPSTALKTHTLPNVPLYVNKVSYVMVDEDEALDLINANFNPYKRKLVNLNLPSVPVSTSTPSVSDEPTASEEPTASPDPSDGPTPTPGKTSGPRPTPDQEDEEETVPSATPERTPAVTQTPTPTQTPTITQAPEETRRPAPTPTPAPEDTE